MKSGFKPIIFSVLGFIFLCTLFFVYKRAEAYYLSCSTSYYRIATPNVDSVQNTGEFRVGDTVYTNAAMDGSEVYTSYTAELYKGNSLYDSYSDVGRGRWFSWGHTINSPGEYLFKFTETDVNGETLSVSSSFVVYDTEPYISSSPSARSVKVGDSTTFSVSAGGSNIEYQWGYTYSSERTGTWYLIEGATSSSYTISSCDSSYNGRYYYCRIINYGNENVFSKPAKLTVYRTITYYNNGGTGSPSSQSTTCGTNMTISSTKPTRTGYDFLGWSTSSTATSANSSYAPGSTYSSNSNLSLYAVWKLKEYTVTYNANGGSGAPSSQTKKYGVSLTLSSVKPTRTGYDFLGWGTSSTATSANSSYAPGSSYTSNANLYLYAVWKAKPDYTVTYDANGGSGAPSSQTKKYDVSLTLSSVKPTRTGYDFLGWSTSSTATSANSSYAPGSSYTSNANLYLYAVWKAKPDYTVTYDANGGSGAPSSQTKKYDVSLTLSSVKPTRTGYDFLGWSTSSTATSANSSYAPGSSYTSNANLYLYAVWKAKPDYTVTYDANGGSGAPWSQTKKYDVSLTLSSVKPTRTGYDFLGWSTSSTATSANSSYAPGSTYTLNDDLNLYAVWKKNIVATPTPKPAKPTPTRKPTPTPIITPTPQQEYTTPSQPTVENPSNITDSSTFDPATSYAVQPVQTSYNENYVASTPIVRNTTISSPTSITESINCEPFYLDMAVTGNGKITYSSSNKKVASISEDGMVTIKGLGKATLTINVAATSEYTAKSRKIKINVVPVSIKGFKARSDSKGRLKISWKTQKTNNTICEIGISKYKDYRVRLLPKKGNYPSVSVGIINSKVKSGATYYVRIRAVTTVNGKKYYGKWTRTARVKIL